MNGEGELAARANFKFATPTILGKLKSKINSNYKFRYQITGLNPGEKLHENLVDKILLAWEDLIDLYQPSLEIFSQQLDKKFN